jgi:mono/diheme cytochrome c family protein
LNKTAFVRLGTGRRQSVSAHFFGVELRRTVIAMRHEIALASFFASLIVPCAMAGEMNGPMSSTPRPSNTATPDVAAPAAAGNFDVEKLFANVCGWCHSNGGRAAGKGPQLMGTTLTDAEIVRRIMLGKSGAMPAFAGAFNGDQINAIVKYIRELKPEGAPK